MTKLDEWTLALLTNREVLKLVSNDYAAKQVERNEDLVIWSCVNKKTGEKYLAYFNLRSEEAEISCDLRSVEQFVGILPEAEDMRSEAVVKEVWSGAAETIEEYMLTARVAAHGAKLFCVDVM